MTSTLIEPERRTEEAWRAVAHYAWEDEFRTALCGAPILGIKATGDFEICATCRELKRGIELA